MHNDSLYCKHQILCKTTLASIICNWNISNLQYHTAKMLEN